MLVAVPLLQDAVAFLVPNAGAITASQSLTTCPVALCCSSTPYFDTTREAYIIDASKVLKGDSMWHQQAPHGRLPIFCRRLRLKRLDLLAATLSLWPPSMGQRQLLQHQPRPSRRQHPLPACGLAPTSSWGLRGWATMLMGLGRVQQQVMGYLNPHWLQQLHVEL